MSADEIVGFEYSGRSYEIRSDRFYLSEPRDVPRADGSTAPIPSPFFSRRALVESLAIRGELRACIFMTYCLRLSIVKREFKTLLATEIPPERQIPVILLHGDQDAAPCLIAEPQDERDLAKSARRYRRYSKPPKAGESDDEEWYYPPEDRRSDVQGISKAAYWEEEVELPSTALVVEVRPTVGERKRRHEASRKDSMGVHHPKVLILFCAERVIIAISTQNLTSGHTTIEGTWVQSFPRTMGDVSKITQQSAVPQQKPPSADEPNDFGVVLYDFLRRQGDEMRRGGGINARANMSDDRAALQCDNQVLHWLTERGMIRAAETLASDSPADKAADEEPACSLQLWLSSIDFSAASVDLLTTVPGTFHECFDSPAAGDGAASGEQGEEPGSNRAARHLADADHVQPVLCACGAPHCRWSIRASRGARSPRERALVRIDEALQYGQFRTAQVLRRRGLVSPDATGLVTASDKLVVQQTSFGMDIRKKLPGFIGRLMGPEAPLEGEAESATDSSGSVDGRAPLLLWTPKRLANGPGASFFTPACYNSLGPDAQSWLHPFEAKRWEGVERMEPHIKTYARVGPRVTLRGPSSDREGPPEEVEVSRGTRQVSWLALTSQCFSEGAQGFFTVKNRYRCRNFEIGVMFTSSPRRRYFTADRLQDVTESVFTASGLSAAWIPLPVPYQIDGLTSYGVGTDMPYFSDEAGLGAFAVTRHWWETLPRYQNVASLESSRLDRSIQLRRAALGLQRIFRAHRRSPTLNFMPLHASSTSQLSVETSGGLRELIQSSALESEGETDSSRAANDGERSIMIPREKRSKSSFVVDGAITLLGDTDTSSTSDMSREGEDISIELAENSEMARPSSFEVRSKPQTAIPPRREVPKSSRFFFFDSSDSD